MGVVSFDKQVTKAYAVTLAPAGKFPIIGDRIFDTLQAAQDYVDGNGLSKTAIPGIYLSVIADGDNNGAYWVEQAAGYGGATSGILRKMGEGGGSSGGGGGEVTFSLASNTTNAVALTINGATKNITAATLKSSLGLKALAYKASLAYSEVTGKPTTLAGYGITDAVAYQTGINTASDYRKIGYAHASTGWKSSGPALIFGMLEYNLALQCVIANNDFVEMYVRQKYNGVEKGWDRIVTEGLLTRGAIPFDTPAYKSYGEYVLHRNVDGGETYLNFGPANNDLANLSVFGYDINFYAGIASSYKSYLSLNNAGTATFFVPLTLNKGAKIAKGYALQIGDATITWDSSAGMLKADKGIYSTADIVAGK